MANFEEGLYRKKYEHDACGIGCIVDSTGKRSHSILQQGLQILQRLEHRGAVGEDPLLGDGAGILLQLDHSFFRQVCDNRSILPIDNNFAVGMIFFPQDRELCLSYMKIFQDIVEKYRFKLLLWRKVPVDNRCLSKKNIFKEPNIYQVYIEDDSFHKNIDFDRKLYFLRFFIEQAISAKYPQIDEDFYICSFSCRTIVYKGMFLAFQLAKYYKDLNNSLFKSSIALVHQRYSTNTFPSWKLAHPYRYTAHNGEINTIQGNINWFRSKKNHFFSSVLPYSLKEIEDIIPDELSDSACFDRCLELLTLSGRHLAHSFMLMVPIAWENDTSMNITKRNFFEYNSALMEPWDGPASIICTDGEHVVAGLDRNGLRPLTYTQNNKGVIVIASERGVIDFSTESIVKKGRFAPGEIMLIDTINSSILYDQDIKDIWSEKYPYQQWLKKNVTSIKSTGDSSHEFGLYTNNLTLYQRAFGYTYEHVYLLLKSSVEAGTEITASMGIDTPLAAFSSRPKMLYDYFKQRFAQVTNPSIDSIREENVMSLRTVIVRPCNILKDQAENCRMMVLEDPFLTNKDIKNFKNNIYKHFPVHTVNICYPLSSNLEIALEILCDNVEKAVDEGYHIIILSDRNVSAQSVPIPALLVTSAVHQHLIQKQKRGKIGIIIESGEIREAHHFALLISFGATAINPYLALETIYSMVENKSFYRDFTVSEAMLNYRKVISSGLKKILAKMGIATLHSYQASQIFEVMGINRSVIKKYFPQAYTSIEGADIFSLEKEILLRHKRTFNSVHERVGLFEGGEYSWKAQGEYHSYNPETIHLLQQAAWKNDAYIYKKFAEKINKQTENLCTIRGLFDFVYDKSNIDINKVEPVEEIVKRFCTGAMSIGSISREAHETLAIAMNRLGGKSNTGEGGEDEIRYIPDKNGDLRISRIKQIASGRFGVTNYYLINANEIQIKIAQGAKPGEGGQLPGFKVDKYIAKLRYTTPGVSLISPPPHHDIYSIEDLAQLIYDLKNVNPQAEVSVKLVSSCGVGTIAAGVAKGKADTIVISGYDGGTGASPASSIKHAGIPWEIGLAETQQVLVKNGLRPYVKLHVDGHVKTGRDVVIGALLGAEEFGFATSALITMGCIMMRKCHSNTCPVGIATQNPYLREKFRGKAEYIQNYLFFVGQEVREIMASLGYTHFNQLIGNVQRLTAAKQTLLWKTQGLDVSSLLFKAEKKGYSPYKSRSQPSLVRDIFDNKLIEEVKNKGIDQPLFLYYKVNNTYRTIGTRLGNEITRLYGKKGLPDDTITVCCEGTVGQSFGAFIPSGITLKVIGDTNDYVGKGLSGGKIIVVPHRDLKIPPTENAIAGNTILYGATSGKAYFYGSVGERFAVRNSGAVAVAVNTGDHCCEYMTGGVVIILGKVGKNFAAGMSGGVVYIFNGQDSFEKHNIHSSLSMAKLQSKTDKICLIQILEDYYQCTRSTCVHEILKNQKEMLPRFIKIIPYEYKKIVEKKVDRNTSLKERQVYS